MMEIQKNNQKKLSQESTLITIKTARKYVIFALLREYISTCWWSPWTQMLVYCLL